VPPQRSGSIRVPRPEPACQYPSNLSDSNDLMPETGSAAV